MKINVSLMGLTDFFFHEFLRDIGCGAGLQTPPAYGLRKSCLKKRNVSDPGPVGSV